MAYPRKYPTSDGTALAPDDWNKMVDLYQGFTPEGNFVAPFSFIVYTNVVDGTTYYYANNAFQLIYGGPNNVGGVNGTNASAVIQAALDALTSGGKIVIKNSLTLNSQVTSSYPLFLEGLGQNVVITCKFTDGYGSPTLKFLDTAIIRNLCFDGEDIGETLLGYEATSGLFTLDNVLVKRAKSVGVIIKNKIKTVINPNCRFEDNEEAIRVTGSLSTSINGKFSGNIININVYQQDTADILDVRFGDVWINGGSVGIEVNVYGSSTKLLRDIVFGKVIVRDIVEVTGKGVIPGSSIQIHGSSTNYIKNVSFSPETWVINADTSGIELDVAKDVSGSINVIGVADKYGLWLSDVENGQFSVLIKNCKDYGVYLYGAEGCKNIVFKGGRVYDDRTPKLQKAFYVGAPGGKNSDEILVMNVDVNDNLTPAIELGNVTNCKTKYNPGYDTENSGTSTGTGAEQTIAHGCQDTPHVEITPTASGTTVSGLYVGATNFYVTVTNGKAYKWKAEVL